MKWLRPDGKTQVTVEYKKEGGAVIPQRVHTILISTQHDEDVTNEQIHKDLMEHVIKPVSAAAVTFWCRDLCDYRFHVVELSVGGCHTPLIPRSSRLCRLCCIPCTSSAGLPFVYYAQSCGTFCAKFWSVCSASLVNCPRPSVTVSGASPPFSC